MTVSKGISLFLYFTKYLLVTLVGVFFCVVFVITRNASRVPNPALGLVRPWKNHDVVLYITESNYLYLAYIIVGIALLLAVLLVVYVVRYAVGRDR